MNGTTTGWPTGYDPARCPVFAHNEFRTALPADRLWPVLIHAADWPRWYAGSRRRGLLYQHQRWLEGLVDTAQRETS